MYNIKCYLDYDSWTLFTCNEYIKNGYFEYCNLCYDVKKEDVVLIAVSHQNQEGGFP